MKQYLSLMKSVLRDGEIRDTRSGQVIGTFGNLIEFDLRERFPAITTKSLAFKAMMGELLWFLNGETTLAELKHRTGLSEDAWTIWTNDCERWHKTQERPYDEDDLGRVYGSQWRMWRNYEGDALPFDQIAHVVEQIKKDPRSRYHVVSAWNVADIRNDEMALPPCHMMFQLYVSEHGYLDLIWYQRSCDVFLGLPFNIASYAALMVIIGQLTGLTPRYLKGMIGDTHVYSAHREACMTQLLREPHECRTVLVKKDLEPITDLEDLTTLTADDFQLVDYTHDEPIRAPLLVG